jgi:Kef-type K+ transport system membrane component KefB
MTVTAVAAAGAKGPDIAQIFLCIVLIVILARVVGGLFRRIHQPAVIGEILAGLLLGASLLGQFSYDGRSLDTLLFPTEIRPTLRVIANLGLVIFMFIVGLELDGKLIRGHERKAGVISLASVALPFTLGVGLAYILYDSHGQGGRLAFTLFLGASMSVTAFPVLARILTERNMHRIPLGVISLACAAIDDVLAWTLLAVVAAIGGDSSLPLWQTFLLSVAYIAAMFLLVRPAMTRILPLYHRAGRLTPDLLAFLLAGLLLSAYTSEKIGLHFVFGAFLFGVSVPRDHNLIREILERLEQVSVLLLLPLFFIVTGLGVDVTKLTGKLLGELLLVLAAAIGGKFIGARIAARAVGVPARRATALGLLMNTRGLTELVLLAVGVELGVLDVELYSMLVVMALVTTFMTAPLLRRVYPDRIIQREIAEAEQAALGIVDAYRVLVSVDDAASGRALLELAADVARAERPAQIVLSQLRPQATAGERLEVGSGLTEELAEIAANLGEMDALAERARADGVDCIVLSRASDDPDRDLLEQIETLGADLVLVPATARSVDGERILRDSPVTVAVVDVLAVPAEGPVVAVVGHGESGDAAVAVAVRMARTRGVPVTLVDESGRRREARRLDNLADRLARAGVDVIGQGPPDGVEPAIVVSPLGSGQPVRAGASLRVRASREQDESELHVLLGRLPVQPGPATDSAPAPSKNI